MRSVSSIGHPPKSRLATRTYVPSTIVPPAGDGAGPLTHAECTERPAGDNALQALPAGPAGMHGDAASSPGASPGGGDDDDDDDDDDSGVRAPHATTIEAAPSASVDATLMTSRVATKAGL